jgi:hypothetical protein
MLPLVAGILPLAAALTALWVFATVLGAPACNILIEGCVSISRTARRGLGHYIFLVLILPAAVAQGLTWVLCGAWLRGLGAARDRALRLLPWLGVAAVVVLAIYAPLLANAGQTYDFMRSYGIPLYFAGTYFCMVITSTKVRRVLGQDSAMPFRHLPRFLVLLSFFVTGAGLMQIGVRPFLDAKRARDHLTNFLEWYSGLAFSLFFFALAALWYYTRFTGQRTAPALAAELAAESTGADPPPGLPEIGRRAP